MIDRYDRRAFLRAGIGASLVFGKIHDAGAFGGRERNATAALRAEIRGSVIARGDPHYEAWRQSMVWQLVKPARFPAVIVQVDDETDVIAAVKFARANGLKVVTRTGGHNFCSSFLRDDSLLVDVSRLQIVEIDPSARRVSVQPGAFGQTLNVALGNHRLAFPTAHCGDVPMGGFLLGGGIGWNGNAWGGMSASNISGIDVVTADGRLRHASSDESSDLLWAGRGGGPAFCGIITRFHLQCYPMPSAVTSSNYIFSFRDLRAFARMLEDVSNQCPAGVELLAELGPAPDELEVDWTREGAPRVCMLEAVAFADTSSQAQEWLRPIGGHPLIARALQKVECSRVTLTDLYQGGDYKSGRLAADNLWTDRLPEVVQVLESRLIGAAPGTLVTLLYKGKGNKVDGACSTFGRFYVGCYPGWEDAADDLANRTWLTETINSLQPFSKGHYINEFDREGRPERTSNCWSAAAWERLRDVRRRFDPEGVFHDFLPLELLTEPGSLRNS